MNFSIIIPNFNGANFLANCLQSLVLAIKTCPKIKFEIILVDNNSKDNSLDVFKKNVPQNFHYRILLNSKNKGFADAVNQGIDQAKYEYVILLNNDLTLESNWFQLISKAIKENKKPNVATFFGTVLTKDGTKFESQGLKFSYSGKAQNISNGEIFNESTINNLPPTISVWGASAALIVYKKEIIKKIGLFDEDFFAYQEDVDLALRLHNLNYQTLYIPKAISYHLGGGTSSLMKNIRSRLSFRNWFFIIIKNYSLKDISNNFGSIIMERLRNFSYFFKETIRIYKIKSLILFPFDLLKTLLEILINFPKMLQKRKVIQKLIKLNNLI